jgi:hypothetical protein
LQLTSIPFLQTNVTALEIGTASHLAFVNLRFPIPIFNKLLYERSQGMPRHRQEGDIKVDLNEMGWS